MTQQALDKAVVNFTRSEMAVQKLANEVYSKAKHSE